jgi:hypothetical protein
MDRADIHNELVGFSSAGSIDSAFLASFLASRLHAPRFSTRNGSFEVASSRIFFVASVDFENY